MCAQGRVVRPLLLHNVNTSAQALQLMGGMRERRNKQCAKIATSVLQLCSFCFFDKIIACSDADAHTFASLCCSLYTLYLFKLTVATGRTESSLPRLHRSNRNLYFAPGVGVKRLGLTTKFAMRFCTSLQCWRMSLIVDCSRQALCCREPSQPWDLHPCRRGSSALEIPLLSASTPPSPSCKMPSLSCAILNSWRLSKVRWMFLSNSSVQPLAWMCWRYSLAFSSRHFLCHQLHKPWLIHTQKLQATRWMLWLR